MRPYAALLLTLAAEVALFGIAGTNFFSVQNAAEVARLSVEVGLLAVALTPVIVTGGIDLSVGSLMSLCAVVTGIEPRARRTLDRVHRVYAIEPVIAGVRCVRRIIRIVNIQAIVMIKLLRLPDKVRRVERVEDHRTSADLPVGILHGEAQIFGGRDEGTADLKRKTSDRGSVIRHGRRGRRGLIQIERETNVANPTVPVSSPCAQSASFDQLLLATAQEN